MNKASLQDPVLVVDDEADIRLIALHLLEHLARGHGSQREDKIGKLLLRLDQRAGDRVVGRRLRGRYAAGIVVVAQVVQLFHKLIECEHQLRRITFCYITCLC